MTVEAMNNIGALIETGTFVTMAFDRQENLWFILAVQNPVTVLTTGSPLEFPPLAATQIQIGTLFLDDEIPGSSGIRFVVTEPGTGIAEVVIRSKGITANIDPNTPGRSFNFVSGLLDSFT